MPIALRGPRKAMRGKCERGRGSANADGGSVNAGAEVQTRTGRVRKSSRAMGTRRRRLSAPWPRFHGADRPDVYIIIHVRACCCGECALNPPTAQPIPRRRPSLAPAQRHALPEHFRSPTQPRRTPAGCAMHARRPHNPFPAEDLRSSTHSDTPFPSTSARPRSPDARPQAARCILSRPHNPFPAEALRSPPHSDTPFPSTSAPLPQRRRTPAGCAMYSPPTSRPIPRRRPSLAPAQRHALAEHFRSPTQRRRTPAGCAMHSPPPSQPISRCATLPPLPFRFGHKKTAPHSACAMPNVSVDRRCGRSFGLVSRALFAAVAGRWRVGVGLRPQPWALRSRRCGRVLRA